MRQLRKEVREQEKQLGRTCPLVARVPDASDWLSVVYGLDLDRWFEEDLIDGTMLSPSPLCIEDFARHHDYHISLAHRHGKICIGGMGNHMLFGRGSSLGTAGWSGLSGKFHPQPLYERARSQYEAGADAMSIYQSEIQVRLGYLREIYKGIGDREAVARRAEELPCPNPDFTFPDFVTEYLDSLKYSKVATRRELPEMEIPKGDHPIGLDFHLHLAHSLRHA